MPNVEPGRATSKTPADGWPPSPARSSLATTSSCHPAPSGDEFALARARADGPVSRHTVPVRRDLIDRLLPWLARIGWILVLVIGSSALDEALDGTTDGRATAVRLGALVAWVAGVAAMAVPSVWSLTASRVVVPVAVPAGVAIWVGGGGTASSVGLLAVAVPVWFVVVGAEFGRVFVQASAYGEEDRHPLRPPAAFLLVASLAWTIWAMIGLAAAFTAATGRWWLSIVLAVGTVAGFALGMPRWHRLSRRWLVFVPIGLVVHDDLVLAETLMLRRQRLHRIGLAPADTDAADLTGPAAGHALEIRTIELVDVVLNPTSKGGAPRPLHLSGCLVAPSRPGRALAAAAERNLPVGPIE